MQVVIPVAVEPRNDSLPWAVASILAHTDYVPITVGHDFGICEHIPLNQLPGLKYARVNTNRAMRVACETFPKGFVWSNDDIYWLKPAEPIRWALGDLADSNVSNLNRQRKTETAALLTRMGLPTFDYEAHVPMTINPPQMLQTLDIVDANPWMLEKRSIYGNLTGLPDRIAPDVKLRNPSDMHWGSEWVSTEGNPARWPAFLGLLSDDDADYGERSERT